jgi:predicted nucleotidyltransferase component of viral defense system
MDKKLRDKQVQILNIFGKYAQDFALSGGTALELYYLRHRFSADIDLFSPEYDIKEIEKLVSEFKKATGDSIKFHTEFIAPNRAHVRFYEVVITGYNRPLKIDFVEDVVFKSPSIKKFKGVPVYSVENIYLQKILAITGGALGQDDIGREITQGRRQARDVFDIYMLSKKIQPLHKFLKELPMQFQRGMVHWYQTFSRQDLKLDLLDLDIYDKGFNAREMIIYLEDEIKKLIKQVLQ